MFLLKDDDGTIYKNERKMERKSNTQSHPKKWLQHMSWSKHLSNELNNAIVFDVFSKNFRHGKTHMQLPKSNGIMFTSVVVVFSE